MMPNIIIESLAIERLQKDISYLSKIKLTEAIATDGSELYEHILYESGDIGFEEKLKRLWTTIKEYMKNLTKMLILKLNSMIFNFKKLRSDLSRVETGYNRICNQPINGLFRYNIPSGDHIDARIDKAINKIILNIDSTEDTIDINYNTFKSITKEKEDKIKQELDALKISQEFVQDPIPVKTISEIPLVDITNTLIHSDSIIQRITNSVKFINKVETSINYNYRLNVVVKMQTSNIVASVISKYYRVQADMLMSYAKIAHRCYNEGGV